MFKTLCATKRFCGCCLPFIIDLDLFAFRRNQSHSSGWQAYLPDEHRGDDQICWHNVKICSNLPSMHAPDELTATSALFSINIKYMHSNLNCYKNIKQQYMGG